MKKILSVILAFVMLIPVSATAFAVGKNDTANNKRIKVGINAQFPPFEYYGENGQLFGFDIDIMNSIGERIGFEIEYVDMSFDKLIPAVMSGEVSCAISAITITKERNEVVDYTIPYLSANVTYEDTVETVSEKYGIVFPNNSAEKGKVLEAAGESDEWLYNLVNKALTELIEDKTVEKLCEKYNLSKRTEDGIAEYEYTVMTVPEDLWDENKDTSEMESVLKTDNAPSDWAKESIDIAYKTGILDKPDYQYKMPITRETFCELIYNFIDVATNVKNLPSENPFKDTSNHKIYALYSAGIINGKSETEFAPDDFLTREEAATIIIRMVNKFFSMPATEMWFEYNDLNDISDWAMDSVQTISNLGFMTGVGNNRFAPNTTLTTEQAIATLVRIYEKNQMNVGIIGGADGPTSIIIGDNITTVEKDGYSEFVNGISESASSVESFYTDEAIKLISEAGELASDTDFISLYTTGEEMTNKILSVGKVDYKNPAEIYLLEADEEKIIDTVKALAGEEAEKIDFDKFRKLNKKYNFTTLASLINGSYGADNLAVTAVLSNSRGYVMPKDFKDNFGLFIRYEGEYSAIVSFSEYGDGVISANMSFVKNGEKDNVFRRMYEIISAVRNDAVKISKVNKGATK